MNMLDVQLNAQFTATEVSNSKIIFTLNDTKLFYYTSREDS